MQEPQETLIWSLGFEDPLEKKMATHPSILAWEIPWTEEPGGIVHRVAEVDTTEWLSTHTMKRNKLDTHNINESQKHYPKSKKPGTKDYDCKILLIWKLVIEQSKLKWWKSDPWLPGVWVYGQRRGLTVKRLEELFEVREMFHILIGHWVPLVYTFVKANYTLY